MSGLNKVTLIGNLGTRPELKYTASGAAVCNMRMAVSTTFGEKESTEWFSVITWNKLAELVAEHLDKGRKVYVEGRLATRSWEAKDGTKRSTTEVIANQVLFLDKADGNRPVATFDPDADDGDVPFE